MQNVETECSEAVMSNSRSLEIAPFDRTELLYLRGPDGERGVRACNWGLRVWAGPS